MASRLALREPAGHATRIELRVCGRCPGSSGAIEGPSPHHLGCAGCVAWSTRAHRARIPKAFNALYSASGVSVSMTSLATLSLRSLG